MKQTWKRVISLLLVCVLLSGCQAATVDAPAPKQSEKPVEEQAATPAADEVSTQKGALPEIGDTIAGFQVKEIVPMEVLGATGILFEHSKSGAQLLYLKSEDTNRSFDITFRTPALDDKGKPHVFEHITICGSQKYPDANMFFPIANQTYNTYMNALTYHGMTSYPVASLSEEQLMTMMDYYLSGVFSPYIYDEPKLAQREAWRYELTDPDAEINIAGTVYSEMQGALTLSAQAALNNLKTLYEGSTTSHESGGIPEDIRTLTYEELVEFHDTYYHPSNALITLYGDLDIDSYLTYIDTTYLSKFDKKEIHVDMGTIEPYTETKNAEYAVPVEKDAETKDVSVINYSFALNGASFEDTLSMHLVWRVILQESSPVMQMIHEKLPNAQISGYLDFDSPSVPYLTVIAAGVNPEDRDLLVEAVDEGLKAIEKDGISEEALDSILSVNKLGLKTTQEDTDLGVNASLSIALGWTYFDNLSYYPTYETVIQNMTKEKADTLVEKYLNQNAHRGVCVTKPVAGLTEKNTQALTKELEEKKKSMSAEEIDELVAQSQNFVEWANTPANAAYVSEVANMQVSDLPEERKHYDITDQTEDGVRYLSAPAEITGVFSGEILLDGSTIPVDQLQDTQLCLWLMGNLDTQQYTKEEVSTLITRYLSGFDKSLIGQNGYQENGYYAAEIEWKGLTEDAETSIKLLSEILFHTDFSDTKTIKSLLTRWNADFTNDIDNNPLSIQLRRCAAMVNDYAGYNEYVNDYDIFAHAKELIKLADTDPEALTQRLTAAQTYLLNRTDATILLAGDPDAIAAYQKEITGIMKDMTAESREKVSYSSLKIPRRSEGIINNSTVQMNLKYSDCDQYSGKNSVICMLLDDVYLLPQLRNALGAYGAYSSLGLSSSALYTYRDPNLAGSYQIFDELPEYLRTADLTQEDVDSYIIGSYSSLSRPQGVLTGAIKAVKDPLIGCSEELRLQWMKDAKATTVEDIRASADIWDKLKQDGINSSSGTESTLKAQGDLFDVYVYPDGTIK